MNGIYFMIFLFKGTNSVYLEKNTSE